MAARILEMPFTWCAVLGRALDARRPGGSANIERQIRCYDGDVATALHGKGVTEAKGWLGLAYLARPYSGVLPLRRDDAPVATIRDELGRLLDDPKAWPADYIRIGYGGRFQGIGMTMPAGLLLYGARAGLLQDDADLQAWMRRADAAWPNWRAAQAWIWEQGVAFPAELYQLAPHNLPSRASSEQIRIFLALTEDLGAVHEGLQVVLNGWARMLNGSRDKRLRARLSLLLQPPQSRTSAIGRLKVAASEGLSP